MRRAPGFIAIVSATCLACGGSRGGAPQGTAGAQDAPPPPAEEAPVAINPDPPIQYPPALFEQKVEGEVVLRLFADSTGKLVAESTKIAESSGYPALDSAAIAGAGKLKFAPAKRHGLPVATAFLQPIEFKVPQGGTGGASGPTP